jgi:hypothetical protein
VGEGDSHCSPEGDLASDGKCRWDRSASQKTDQCKNDSCPR